MNFNSLRSSPATNH